MTIKTHEILEREVTYASPHDPIQGKILVTGATGFLGVVLTRKLCAYGVQMVALGRDCERGAQGAASGTDFQTSVVLDPAPIGDLGGTWRLLASDLLSSDRGTVESFKLTVTPSE